MKAELPDGVASSPSTAVGTPDNASTIEVSVTAGASESSNGSGTETLAASSASVKSTASSKIKQKQKAAPEAKPSPKKDSDNLVGKIMNLISTDTNNITESRDIMLLRMTLT